MKNRVGESNNNKVIFQVYAMDDNGANMWQDEEFGTFESAKNHYDKLMADNEGDEKHIFMIVVDEEDCIIAESQILFEKI
jgi:hypothetical protein